MRDQPPGLIGVEPVSREEHGLDPARHLHELMDAGPMRERRQDEGGVPVGGARHQVAEVVRDHEGHLAVRQHRGLGTARRARRVEEPAWIVMLDGRGWYADAIVLRHQGIVILAELRSSDGNHEPDVGGRLACGRDVFGKVGMADHGGGAARLAEIGNLTRRLPEVRRHPDRADPEAGEHRLEHLVAVLGLHQDAITFLHASGDQCSRHRVDPPVKLGPGPGRIAPDKADVVP